MLFLDHHNFPCYYYWGLNQGFLNARQVLYLWAAAPAQPTIHSLTIDYSSKSVLLGVSSSIYNIPVTMSWLMRLQCWAKKIWLFHQEAYNVVSKMEADQLLTWHLQGTLLSGKLKNHWRVECWKSAKYVTHLSVSVPLQLISVLTSQCIDISKAFQHQL